MYASVSVATADPFAELLAWLYKEIYEGYSQILTIYFYRVGGHVLELPWDLDATREVRSELTTLVVATYVVMVVAGGVIVMSHETVQTQYSMKEILPRLAMGLALAWLAGLILTQIQKFNNDVVSALLDLTENSLHHWTFEDLYPSDLMDGLYSILGVKEIAHFTVVTIIVLVAKLIGVLILLVSAVLRNICWFGLLMFAPLALACHGLPFTDGLARMWWRLVGACMGSSIGQAACVYVWARMAFDEDGNAIGENGRDDIDAFDLDLLYIAITIWAMWKVHAAAFAWARGRPTRFPGARFARVLGGVAMWRTMDKFGVNRRTKRRRSPTPARSNKGESIAPVTGAAFGAGAELTGETPAHKGHRWPPRPASDFTPKKGPRLRLSTGSGDSGKTGTATAPGDPQAQHATNTDSTTARPRAKRTKPPVLRPAPGTTSTQAAAHKHPTLRTPPTSTPPIRLRPPKPAAKPAPKPPPFRSEPARDSRKDETP